MIWKSTIVAQSAVIAVACAAVAGRVTAGIAWKTVDNDTVALTHAANTRPVAGTIRAVETGGVWVKF